MPQGGEARAEAFYADVLGMNVARKPAVLRGRGGIWFELGDLRVHLGVEDPFRPATKAHPAFRVRSLEQSVARLRHAGIAVRHDIGLPSLRRIYIEDPFGNRIELLEEIATLP